MERSIPSLPASRVYSLEDHLHKVNLVGARSGTGQIGYRCEVEGVICRGRSGVA